MKKIVEEKGLHAGLAISLHFLLFHRPPSTLISCFHEFTTSPIKEPSPFSFQRTVRRLASGLSRVPDRYRDASATPSEIAEIHVEYPVRAHTWGRSDPALDNRLGEEFAAAYDSSLTRKAWGRLGL
jgi:hypothetical protein